MTNKDINFDKISSIISKNPEQTFEFGIQFSKKVVIPSIIVLEGDLGAGKTLFVKGFAKGLNINENIVSPTFTILNQYKANSVILNHFDLYRINDFEELYYIGIEDFLNDENAINIFEWGNQFIEYFEEYNINIIKIRIEILSNFSRKISIDRINQ